MEKRETIEIRLIRSATLRLTYAGKTFIVAPMLSAKGAFRSFARKAPNPIVDLTMDLAAITEGLDAALITHAHPDHFDDAAKDALPKGLPVFIQRASLRDAKKAGFTDVRPVDGSIEWEGMTIRRTGGRHGRGLMAIAMGTVSGFVLSARNAPTVYIAGDCVLDEDVKKAVSAFDPDVIIVNSGGAMIGGSNRILMDAAETVELAKLAPRATVVAVHMEALDHCTVTRAALRAAADAAGLGGRIVIPADGETVRAP